MIEFKHLNRQHLRHEYLGSYTFYLDTLSHAEMEDIAINYLDGIDNLTLPFGVARVHPDDQYVKSVGRQVAFENAREVNFHITAVHITKDEIRMVLETCHYRIVMSSNSRVKKFAKFVDVIVKEEV